MPMKFTNEDGSTIVFELETQPQELPDGNKVPMPIKLGDGNFGCVFAARGADGAPLALKVIYEHEAKMQDGSTADVDYKELRVREELTVRRTIYDRLNSSLHERDRSLVAICDRHLALPLGHSTTLDVEPEFKKFAEVYKEHDLILSKYGYVMTRYDCSLKDLMEYGGRITSTGSPNREPGEDRTPYSRLRTAPIIERERSALPIIQQIANGLHILHAAGLRHQDIKPANIYYRGDMTSVEFALGDLGFLHVQNPVLAGSAMVSSDALAIGTKHYRSVEQIDHSDVSEVSIEAGSDQLETEVVSRDPKFMRTNIGKGDLVMFPRSGSRTLFGIGDVSVEEELSEIRMSISSQAIPGSVNSATLALRDGLTQASFVKNPTERTDLFGLGAVLFDIISAGESAERFYELLRKFDVKGTRIQSVVLNYYPAWKTGQDVAPDISAIFQRVNGDKRSDAVPGTLVSPSILAFLLNCLMSEPDDSYYMRFFSEHGDERPQTWSAVTSNIEALVRELNAHTYDKIETNVLTSEKYPKTGVISTPPPPDTVSALLSDIQQRRTDSSRWLRVASFLLQVTQLTKLAMGKIASPDDTAFISMAPEHLVVDYNHHIIHHNVVIGQCTRSEYLNRLSVLDPVFSSVQSQSNSFLPIWWDARKNKSELSLFRPEDAGVPQATEVQDGDGTVRVNLKYVDCTAPGLEARTGDFVLVSNDDALYSLYDVTEAGAGYLNLRRNEDLGDERGNREVEFRADEFRTGYVVKSFNVDAYYGGMLAVYLFHSLLAGGVRPRIEHFGRAVKSESVNFPRVDLPVPSEVLADAGGGIMNRIRRTESPPLDRNLVSHTIRLYAWLMLGGFLGGGKPDQAIASEISKWSEQVGKTFGVRVEEIRDRLFVGSAGDPSSGKVVSIDHATFERIARSYLRNG